MHDAEYESDEYVTDDDYESDVEYENIEDDDFNFSPPQNPDNFNINRMHYTPLLGEIPRPDVVFRILAEIPRTDGGMYILYEELSPTEEELEAYKQHLILDDSLSCEKVLCMRTQNREKQVRIKRRQRFANVTRQLFAEDKIISK